MITTEIDDCKLHNTLDFVQGFIGPVTVYYAESLANVRVVQRGHAINILVLQAAGIIDWPATNTARRMGVEYLGKDIQPNTQADTQETQKPGRYEHAGKVGPWARRGAKGTRYLKRGLPDKSGYYRILAVEKGGETWRFVDVTLETLDVRSVGCGTDTYTLITL